ncbi:hypothetical protein WN944_006669 [Citrus x changshan-huyou]|uniref:Uncharacterized protein n=1 Tax=Citrus x changshan-huyou TaxID=2935761 RepID=A0AAP0MPQ6_9ROSI
MSLFLIFFNINRIAKRKEEAWFSLYNSLNTTPSHFLLFINSTQPLTIAFFVIVISPLCCHRGYVDHYRHQLPFNLLIGAKLDSSVVSITSLQLMFRVVIS